MSLNLCERILVLFLDDALRVGSHRHVARLRSLILKLERACSILQIRGWVVSLSSNLGLTHVDSSEISRAVVRSLPNIVLAQLVKFCLKVLLLIYISLWYLYRFKFQATERCLYRYLTLAIDLESGCRELCLMTFERRLVNYVVPIHLIARPTCFSPQLRLFLKIM